MVQAKEINIKNQTYYFFNDMVDIKIFHSNLLKIDKKLYKDIDIYYIGCITIKKFGDCENSHSVNLLYLIINQASGYIEKKKKGNKYLIFDNSVDENKEVLKKYTDLWNGIKYEIKTIHGGKENDYGKIT